MRSSSGYINGALRAAASPVPLVLMVMAAATVEAAIASPVVEAKKQASRGQGQSKAEDRFQRLVKALKLDATQQAEVRRVLEDHREAIRRVKSAPPDPQVPRIVALRAISDRTTERIRAVLNDEQKKLYKQPLPHDFEAGEGKRGVDEWLNVLQPERK